MTTPLCARCGAPLPEEAVHSAVTCAYCGAANAAAPQVIERVVVVAGPAEDGRTGLRCPRCAEVMASERSGQTNLHGCERCGGVWLDPTSVEHASNVNDEDLVKAAFRLVGLTLRRPPDARPTIGCPVCSAQLRRVRIKDEGSEIDVCDAHGTWFDRGELGAFVKAHSEARAGDVTDEDLRAAGLPGAGLGATEGDGGFFSDLFRSLRFLAK